MSDSFLFVALEKYSAFVNSSPKTEYGGGHFQKWGEGESFSESSTQRILSPADLILAGHPDHISFQRKG